MAVPKRKQTPSRTGMRRAQNMKFSSKNIVEDKKSGEYRLSHHIDLKTGMAIITAIAVLGGFYYTTQHRLDHLEGKVTALQGEIERVEKIAKRKKK